VKFVSVAAYHRAALFFEPMRLIVQVSSRLGFHPAAKSSKQWAILTSKMNRQQKRSTRMGRLRNDLSEEVQALVFFYSLVNQGTNH
jgi:hypothetical protein